MKLFAQRMLWWSVPLLWCLVLASAVGAIYFKHRSRELFVELQQLNSGRDELEAEWGRLQLEQSAWSAYGYVEQVATQKLHMRTPGPREIQVVSP